MAPPASWDIRARNLTELRAWPAASEITVEQFKQLEVFRAHVGSMTWLRDL
jgi:hypothetical protein